MKTIVFIPTYNDSEHLNALVDELKSSLPDIKVLIIDDGSILPIQIYRRVLKVRIPFNLGLGVATHVAVDYALHSNYDVLVRIDADGQHKVGDIKLLLEQVSEDADVVIGGRQNRNEFKNFNALIRNFSKLYISIVTRMTLWKKIPEDLNSGFMVMNRNAMKVVNMLELDRYPETQILINAISIGLKVVEVPIVQEERKHGVSTLRVMPGLALLFRISMYCLLVFLRRRK